MDGRAVTRICSSRARSVEEAVAQHEPIDTGRRSDDALQVDDPGQYGVIGDVGRVEKRVSLIVRLRAWGIEPRAALGNHPGRSGRQGRVHQVARSDLAKARVRSELFGTEARREVGQLMDHDVRAGVDDSCLERVGVQRVDDDWMCALRTQTRPPARQTGSYP